MGRTSFLNARRARTLDVAIVVWSVFWLVLAVLVAVDIHNMGQLTNTVVRTTGGLRQVTDGLQLLGNLPLVGGGLSQIVSDVNELVVAADNEANSTRASINRVSVYAGVSVALIPTMLMLAFYLPWRLPWGRHVRSVRAALAQDPLDPILDRYLAVQALDTMTYDELRRVSDDPRADVAEGRCRSLADAELARLGIRRA